MAKKTKGLTLKEATRTGKLKQFIKEHPEQIGNKSRFNATLESMVKTTKDKKNKKK